MHKKHYFAFIIIGITASILIYTRRAGILDRHLPTRFFMNIYWPGSSSSSRSVVRFNSMYADRMVLQMEPAKSVVWGYGLIGWGFIGKLECKSQNGDIHSPPDAMVYEIGEGGANNGTWRMDLPPQAAGTICNISVIGGSEDITLNEVIFGDVWLCGGQSNMEQGMGNIINASSEIAASAKFTNIRFMQVLNKTSEDPDTDDLEVELYIPWADSSDSGKLWSMGAVCYLFARKIQELQGDKAIPMGLIGSYWNGTGVEAWSNKKMLDKCHVTNNHQNPIFLSNQVLWNAMINPIKRTTLKGFLWYQGERNTNPGYNTDIYNCTFPAMIDGWREEFSANSGTSQDAPFGFVQLATINYGAGGYAGNYGYPEIRWHQTADYGYVPNEKLKNVFMSVGIDTVDSKGGYPGNLHPRYKQAVSDRLAIAGMNVVYGEEKFPTRGPWPVKFSLSNKTITLKYSDKMTYNKDTISGFYFCCGSNFDHCQNYNDIPKAMVELKDDKSSIGIKLDDTWKCIDGENPHLAYLWKQSPYQKPFTAAIYSDDEFKLPGAPWKFASSSYTKPT